MSSQDIWDGNYRRCRRNSVLAVARKEYQRQSRLVLNVGPVAAYASVLYSALGDDWAKIKRFKVQYLPHFIYVFFLLRNHLREVSRVVKVTVGNPVFAGDWTLDRIEVVSSILLSFGSKFNFLEDARMFRERGSLLLYLAQGIEGVTGGRDAAHPKGGHTRSLLDLTWMKWALRYPENIPLKPKTRQWAEDAVRDLLPDTEKAVDEITDPNQRSRCYRGIAEVYSLLGEVNNVESFILKAQSVPGISQSTIDKNETAHRSM